MTAAVAARSRFCWRAALFREPLTKHPAILARYLVVFDCKKAPEFPCSGAFLVVEVIPNSVPGSPTSSIREPGAPRHPDHAFLKSPGDLVRLFITSHLTPGSDKP